MVESEKTVSLALAGPSESGKTHFCHRIAFNQLPVVNDNNNFVETYNKTVTLGKETTLRI